MMLTEIKYGSTKTPMPIPTFKNSLFCWWFGHKWEGERMYAADANFEFCNRCGLRNEANTVYYKKPKENI